MGTIFVESFIERDSSNRYHIDLESFITIYVYKECYSKNVDLKLLRTNIRKDEQLFGIVSTDVEHELIDASEVPKIATYCTWPVIIVENTVVAGLASVARQIIKSSSDAEIRKLLGFREACLMACSENSIWTKFCEVDILKMIKTALICPKEYLLSTNLVSIPLEVSRFEEHMKQPVRLHNVYKEARIRNNDKLIQSSVPIEELNVKHEYCEGLYMTLTDLLLFPCFYIFFQIFDCVSLIELLPVTLSWFTTIQKNKNTNFIPKFAKPFHLSPDCKTVTGFTSKDYLTRSNVSPVRPKNHTFTQQDDVDAAISMINCIVTNEHHLSECYTGIEFKWENVPLEVNPKGGALPEKRANRKCQQLESVAKAVLKLCGSKNHIIVDFCSGSGHLGILIATLLPQCEIILVENKELSLKRAKERVLSLNLTNVSLVQSNLDYFKSQFNLGMALHACGVATDLVLQACIENGAKFVCCPCCYGGIHDCHHLTYPRSDVFLKSGMTRKEYLNIAHAADQTHDKSNMKTAQGFRCMDIIDTDRKLQAEECRYKVYLGKLDPPSCTPKNNLLIGYYNNEEK